MYLTTVDGTTWFNSLCTNTANLRAFASSLTNWNAGWGAEFSLSSRDSAALSDIPNSRRVEFINALNSLADEIDYGSVPDVGIRVLDTNPTGTLASTHWVLHANVTVLHWPFAIQVASCWVEIVKN